MVATREPLDAVQRAKIEEAPAPSRSEPAALHERAVAAAIDTVLYLGAGWVVAATIFAVLTATSAGLASSDSPQELGLARVKLWALVPVCYLLVALMVEVWALRRHGTTVGRSRLGLRVESVTDSPLTTGRLLVRLLLGTKGPLAPLAIAYHLVGPRGLEDALAGTRVVKSVGESAVVTGKLAYLPGILSALAAAMAVLGLLLLARFEALFVELDATHAPIARIAAEWRSWVVLWAPAGGLAVALVWLRPRSRFDVVAAWWVSVILLILAVVGLLVLGPIGLMSILSLHMTLSG